MMKKKISNSLISKYKVVIISFLIIPNLFYSQEKLSSKNVFIYQSKKYKHEYIIEFIEIRSDSIFRTTVYTSTNSVFDKKINSNTIEYNDICLINTKNEINDTFLICKGKIKYSSGKVFYSKQAPKLKKFADPKEVTYIRKEFKSEKKICFTYLNIFEQDSQYDYCFKEAFWIIEYRFNKDDYYNLIYFKSDKQKFIYENKWN